MSLILDALKKAEQDRHAGQVPVIDEMLVRRPPAAASRRRNPQQDVLLMAAALLAVLFAVAGLAYWLWPSPARQSTPVVAEAPAAEPAPAGPALRIDPERLQAPIAVADETLDPADTGASEAMTLDDLDATAEDAPALPPPAARSEIPVEVVQAPTPAPALAPAAVEPSARPLKEMPPAFRSEFPKLTVDVHVFDDNPLRRFVLINGKKYRETDTLLDGPRVVEIAPGGVVVDHRGSKVLLELPR